MFLHNTMSAAKIFAGGIKGKHRETVIIRRMWQKGAGHE